MSSDNPFGLKFQEMEPSDMPKDCVGFMIVGEHNSVALTCRGYRMLTPAEHDLAKANMSRARWEAEREAFKRDPMKFMEEVLKTDQKLSGLFDVQPAPYHKRLLEQLKDLASGKIKKIIWRGRV